MHAGDVNPDDAYAALVAQDEAVLVDVRTRAEWNFVGMPDLSGVGKRVLPIEWQRGDGSINPDFVETLRSTGVGSEAPLYFICRSGARSASAAAAATAAGFAQAHNVAHGFEGPPNGDRQRGKVAGWKVDGLPWVQG